MHSNSTWKKGSPSFSAPEQGEKGILTVKTDYFGFGKTLIETLLHSKILKNTKIKASDLIGIINNTLCDIDPNKRNFDLFEETLNEAEDMSQVFWSQSCMNSLKQSCIIQN